MTRIIATYDPPPIPLRHSDWSAVLDTYDAGDPIGWGRTREEAVADLEERLTETAVGYLHEITARCVEMSPEILDAIERCRELETEEHGHD